MALLAASAKLPIPSQSVSKMQLFAFLCKQLINSRAFDKLNGYKPLMRQRTVRQVRLHLILDKMDDIHAIWKEPLSKALVHMIQDKGRFTLLGLKYALPNRVS